MLDMGLVKGKPALKVNFRYSLAADMLHTMALMRETDNIDGLDRWMYETHRMLPATLKVDILMADLLANGSGMLFALIYETPDDAPLHYDFTAFMQWIRQLSLEQVELLTQATLACLCGHCDEPESGHACKQDPIQLREVLTHKLPAAYLERAVGCVRNPSALKELLESTLLRFWEQFYAKQYAQCAPLMQRSVQHHQQQTYSTDIHTVISQVTGRQMERELDNFNIDSIESIVFLPSAHLGPYLMFAHVEEPVPTLYVHFNGRSTSIKEPGTETSTLSIQVLYPPLKALADETRLQILTLLQGKELYAQEIVNQLDISQSAVSRHLKLMTVGGILTVRKAESMRYYAINTATVETLIAMLRDLRGLDDQA